MLDLGQHGRQLNLRLPAMPLSAKQVVHIVIIIFEWLIIHMCTFHQAVYFGASKKTVMPYGWRGNYSFGICTGQPCILDLNGLSVSRLYGTWYCLLFGSRRKSIVVSFKPRHQSPRRAWCRRSSQLSAAAWADVTVAGQRSRASEARQVHVAVVCGQRQSRSVGMSTSVWRLIHDVRQPTLSLYSAVY